MVGRIVCSVATAELARPALPGHVSLRHLGTFRLKDLLAPERAFQVDGVGLATQFGALRTLDVARHNLPVQRTRRVGRDAEVAALIDALQRSRLVTLTGVGGCGKTRLAVAVAAEMAAGCEDGVFFVPLAVVMHADGVLAAVTEAMGIRLEHLVAPATISLSSRPRTPVPRPEEAAHLCEVPCPASALRGSPGLSGATSGVARDEATATMARFGQGALRLGGATSRARCPPWPAVRRRSRTETRAPTRPSYADQKAGRASSKTSLT
jgi:hypothetical protein